MLIDKKTKRARIQTGEAWIGLDVCEPRLLLSNTMLDYFPITMGNTWNYQGEVNGGQGTAKLTSASGGLVDGVATTLFTLAVKDGSGTATAKLFVTNTDDGLELHRLQIIDSVTETFNFAVPLLLSGAEFDPADLLTSEEISVSGTSSGDGATDQFTGTVIHQTSFQEQTTVVSTLGEIAAFPVEFSFQIGVAAIDNSWSSTIDFSLNFYLARFAGPVGVDVFYQELVEEPGAPSELITFTAEQIVTASALLKPRVSIEAVDPTGEEGSDSPNFRITRQSALALDQPLTVSISRSGTAKFGATADYTLTDGDDNVLTSTVIIPANEDSVDINVIILDDQLAEVDETVILALSSNSAYTIDPQAKTATTTIEDNEPMVRIDKLSDTGEDEEPGVFRISRDTTQGALIMNFNRKGTAKFGPKGDYTLSVDGQNLTTTFITIPDGQNHVDVIVIPVNDLLAEVDETVILTLKTAKTYTLDGDDLSAQMTVTDDEPMVRIDKLSDTGEDEEPGVFRISRDTTQGALIVNFNRKGTAKFGPKGDYTLSVDGQNLTTTFITIPDGQNHVDVIVIPVNDLLAEVDETVILTLKTAKTYKLDDKDEVATMEIADDEPVVSIEKISDTHEGLAPGVFRISRSASQGALAVNLTRSGTAKFGATGDYTLVVDGVTNITGNTVTIPVGEDHVDVKVHAVDDSAAELTESVILTVAPLGTYMVDAGAKSATAFIQDNE